MRFTPVSVAQTWPGVTGATQILNTTCATHLTGPSKITTGWRTNDRIWVVNRPCRVPTRSIAGPARRPYSPRRGNTSRGGSYGNPQFQTLALWVLGHRLSHSGGGSSCGTAVGVPLRRTVLPGSTSGGASLAATRAPARRSPGSRRGLARPAHPTRATGRLPRLQPLGSRLRPGAVEHRPTPSDSPR